MTSKIKYQKDYTEFNETYQLVLPLSLEGLVPDDDSVRLLSHELEELDYTLLYKAYSSKGRNPAVDPNTMFKILTYAYSQNIYSSRKIEKMVSTHRLASWEFHCFSTASAAFHKVLRSAYSCGALGGSRISLWTIPRFSG